MAKPANTVAYGSTISLREHAWKAVHAVMRRARRYLRVRYLHITDTDTLTRSGHRCSNMSRPPAKPANYRPSRQGRQTRTPPKASDVSSGASRASGRGRGGVRRPRSPPKRWPRSAPRPPLPAWVPPDGRNPPRQPGSGEPWMWRSPRSCGTPCSGAPKRPRSNGPMSSSGRMDRDGSRSAARRPTRKAREPSSTSGRGPSPISGRSAPRTRTPVCSASALDAPRPATSPLWQGQPGSKARSPDIPPASGWPAISWPPGPPSPPSRVAGRWASARLPAHYVRGELAGRGAVARFYGGCEGPGRFARQRAQQGRPRGADAKPDASPPRRTWTPWAEGVADLRWWSAAPDHGAPGVESSHTVARHFVRPRAVREPAIRISSAFGSGTGFPSSRATSSRVTRPAFALKARSTAASRIARGTARRMVAFGGRASPHAPFLI